MARARWKESVRIKTEASFAAAVPATIYEWSHGLGGATGINDLPVALDDAPLRFVAPPVFPNTKSGVRSMNTELPSPGGYLAELGTINVPFYPELMHPLLKAMMGSFSGAESAGSAAKSSIAFASLATLDTQPNSEEQLKFVISSSTAASSAAINIIQSGATQETITIGTLGTTVDGTYYSKGKYDGSVNAITFTVTGTVTAGLVVVSGVDYSTNTYTLPTDDSLVSLMIEQQGRIEDGSNSQFLRGCVVPSASFAYDANARDGMLMIAMPLLGAAMTRTTATTFKQDTAYYYRPFMSWHCAVTFDAVANLEVMSASININPNTEMYKISSGTQYASGALAGEFEVFGEMTLIPADNTRITDFEGATARDVNFTFTSGFTVGNSQPYVFTIEVPQLILADYTPAHDGIKQTGTVSFRGIYDSAHSGAARLTTICQRSV